VLQFLRCHWNAGRGRECTVRPWRYPLYHVDHDEIAVEIEINGMDIERTGRRVRDIVILIPEVAVRKNRKMTRKRKLNVILHGKRPTGRYLGIMYNH